MNIEIRKLTPDLAEDYVLFFDATPHWYDSDERKCYCVPYCNDDYEEIKALVTTQEAIRKYTIECVKGGKLQGYIAYYARDSYSAKGLLARSCACKWHVFVKSRETPHRK